MSERECEIEITGTERMKKRFLTWCTKIVSNKIVVKNTHKIKGQKLHIHGKKRFKAKKRRDSAVLLTI